jgi:phospholipid/cholesterol/gamma-HCH transport system permease protein
MENEPSSDRGWLEIDPVPTGAITLRLHGALSNATVPGLWDQARGALVDAAPAALVVDASGVSYMDMAGIALLFRLQNRASEAGAPSELRGLNPRFQWLIDRIGSVSRPASPDDRRTCVSLPEQIGRTTSQLWGDFKAQVGFVGELAEALARAALQPRKIRWSDLWMAAERAGTDALPIVCLIAGLVGLVLAFQSAMAMRPYGAEVYVANLVTIAMLRELGPLMTAIILSGRSGGAFAAEIGTMKVNDEVAALWTMGLNPVPFLAVPRVLALVMTIPFLTLFANVVGILGGAVMFLSLDYPLSTYFNQALSSAEVRHLLSGLVKSVAFGITIAGVACMRGLQTLQGPSAVGVSTTRAVVTSILLIVVIDAILGTIFYFLHF